MNITSTTSSPPNHTNTCEPPYDEENPLPLVVLYSAVLTLGLPANLITVFLTVLEVCQKNVLGIYLFSLSVCDLMYLGTLPLWAIYINRGHRWEWGSLSCKLMGYVFFNNMYISIFLMCCVSADRFVAVVYAVESRGLRRMRHAVIITVVIVVVVAVGHVPVFSMTEGESEKMKEKRCFEPSDPSVVVTGLNYARFFIGFFIPLCILIVTNLAIIAKVQASTGLKPQTKIKIRNLAFAVILFFLVCFTPYHVILLLRAINFHFSNGKCDFERSIYTPYTISLGLSTINSAINPVFYVLSSNSVHKRIHKGLRRLRSSSRSSSFA
ncbi:probable G-protein coupled receptor 132 [Sinocyclocheilus rhinocerous]|uniref:Probable G-protein coupled receptor 132 n=1 Tax=Sinocyclocheilus rhinocerous TaxID=307959 RepID=A0A673KMU2_9TELE|nr:PREDICTED: probable G-protein coupled receptor 132 [Sinocyclocheilus rhinocerous]XP_016399792.1 PREDICTED: probable G-protein coupled receptor 132 [Sinocyclocheilus rhinocerous]